ncbi:hypothetical protein [Hellea balneolensis]|uniref:hypothetical protein n=1 Tax=Hellea balneolensis TaxID=287478 RepID=UPI000479389B|nr:hypothetical protein [Hellea balneolensis]
MIRNLEEEELEYASGGFNLGEYTGLPNGHRVNFESSAYALSLGASVGQRANLSNLVGMAPPEPQPRIEPAEVMPQSTPEIESLSLPICRDRRGRYAICQTDGMNERWESYRPQQPSFRSRFINR